MNKKVTKKATKITLLSIIALLLTSALVLTCIGVFYKRKKPGETPTIVNPLDFATSTWDGETVNSSGWLNGNQLGNRGEKTFTITNAESFAYFMDIVNNEETAKQYNYFKDYTVYLNSNININGNSIKSIGVKMENGKSTFQGRFNGAFYTIFNANIVGTGLFGFVTDANIENLGLYNIKVNSDEENVGALVGSALDTNLQNISIRLCDVAGKQKVGNLVGNFLSTTGEHFVKNVAIDSNISSNGGAVIGNASANMSSASKVTISNVYYTNNRNPINTLTKDDFVTTENVVYLTNSNQLQAWGYQPEYSAANAWCDYKVRENSTELDFRFPIQTQFYKALYNGSYIENTITNSKGETIEVSSLAEAFNKADADSEISIIVKKVFVDEPAIAGVGSKVTLKSDVATTVARETGFEDSVVVGATGSQLTIGEADGASITFDGNREFVENNNTLSNALVYAQGNRIHVENNVTFKNNVNNDAGYGGAVCVYGVKTKVDEEENINVKISANVENCSAAYYGGGVCIIGAASEVSGDHISGCSATNGGGVAFIDELQENSARAQQVFYKYGGSLIATPTRNTYSSGTNYLTSHVEMNSTSASGAGVYCSGSSSSKVTLYIGKSSSGGYSTYVRIYSNTSTSSRGGGIYANYAYLYNCTNTYIQSNKAVGAGAGLFAMSSSVDSYKEQGSSTSWFDISGNTLTSAGSVTITGGSGIFLSNCTGSNYFANCRIYNNKASFSCNGAGLYAYGSSASCTISLSSNTYFYGNSSSSDSITSGYNIYLNGSSTTINGGNSTHAIPVYSSYYQYVRNGGVYIQSGTYKLDYLAPSRSGYTFGGWSTLAASTSNSWSSGTKSWTSGNPTQYFAYFYNTKTYNYYSTSTSSTYSTKSVTYYYNLALSKLSGSVPSDPSSPTRSGYDFIGWYRSSSSTSNPGYTTSSASEDNIYNYAVWSRRLTVNYYSTSTSTVYATGGNQYVCNCINSISSITVSSSQTPANPTRTGYTFAGWYRSTSSTTSPGTTVTSGHSFSVSAARSTYYCYAVWRRNVTVNYYSTSASTPFTTKSGAVYCNITGTIPDSATVSITDPTTPTRSGYTFSKWRRTATKYTAEGDINSSSSTDISSTSYPAKAASTTYYVYAIWSRTLTVYFYSESTSTIYYTGSVTSSVGPEGTKTQMQLYTGSSYPTKPTRPGYDFYGWYGNGTTATTNPGTTKMSSSYVYQVNAASTTYYNYAIWGKPITMTVNFNANGHGTAPASRSDSGTDYYNCVLGNRLPGGERIYIPAYPTAVGWTCTGWNTAQNGSGTNYTPDQEFWGHYTSNTTITLFAQWSRKTYIFDINAYNPEQNQQDFATFDAKITNPNTGTTKTLTGLTGETTDFNALPYGTTLVFYNIKPKNADIKLDRVSLSSFSYGLNTEISSTTIAAGIVSASANGEYTYVIQPTSEPSGYVETFHIFTAYRDYTVAINTPEVSWASQGHTLFDLKVTRPDGTVNTYNNINYAVGNPYRYGTVLEISNLRVQQKGAVLDRVFNFRDNNNYSTTEYVGKYGKSQMVNGVYKFTVTPQQEDLWSGTYIEVIEIVLKWASYDASFNANYDNSNENMFNPNDVTVNTFTNSTISGGNSSFTSVPSGASVDAIIIRADGVTDACLYTTGWLQQTFTQDGSKNDLLFIAHHSANVGQYISVDISGLPIGTYTASCYVDTYTSASTTIRHIKIERGSARTAYAPYAQTEKYSKNYSTLPTPTRDGYKFDGWYAKFNYLDMDSVMDYFNQMNTLEGDTANNMTKTSDGIYSWGGNTSGSWATGKFVFYQYRTSLPNGTYRLSYDAYNERTDGKTTTRIVPCDSTGYELIRTNMYVNTSNWAHYEGTFTVNNNFDHFRLGYSNGDWTYFKNIRLEMITPSDGLINYAASAEFEENLGANVDTGEVVAANGYYIHRNFIPFANNTGSDIILKSNYTLCAIYAYDKDYNYIKRCGSYVTEFPIPSGTAYIRIGQNVSYLSFAERAKLTVTQQINFADSASFENGKEVAGADGIRDNSGYWTHYNLIPFANNTGSDIVLKTNYELCAIYAYDKDMNFIQRCGSYVTEFPIPSGTAYIRIEQLASKLSFANSKLLTITCDRQAELYADQLITSDSVYSTLGDVTLHAKWKDGTPPTIQRVTYKEDGATGYIVGYTIYAYVTDNLDVNRVQFAGYTTLNGMDDIDPNWATSAACSGKLGDYTVDGEYYNYRFYLYFKDHNAELVGYKCNIHAYDNDGNMSYYMLTLNNPTVSVTVDEPNKTYPARFGEALPTMTVPTKEGYEFAGYYYGDVMYVNSQGVGVRAYDFTTQASGIQVPMRNVELEARWQVKNYTITIKLNDNSYGDVSIDGGVLQKVVTLNVPHGSTITIDDNSLLVDGHRVDVAPHDPDVECIYSFGGFTGVTDGQVVTSAMTIVANLTRTIKTYTVTIEVDNPSFGSVSTTTISGVEHGTEITKYGNYTLRFGGAERSVIATPATATNEFEYKFVGFSVEEGFVTNNMTIIAHFVRDPRVYSIEFNAGNNCESVVLSPVDGAAENFEINGNYIHGVPYNTTISVNGNVLTIGNVQVVATAEERTGYHISFNNWKRGSYVISNGYKVVGNSTITANFGEYIANTDTQYTVTKHLMNAQTGEYYAQQPRTYTGTTGSAVNLESLYEDNIVAGGTELDYIEVDGVIATEATISADGSLTIDIYIKRLKHTLTLVAGEGVESIETVSGEYYYGQTIALKATLKEGYYGLKWNDEDKVTFTMGTGDETLTATGTLNVYTITIEVNNSEYGSVDKTIAENIPHGSVLTRTKNYLRIAKFTSEDLVLVYPTAAEQTAQYTYEFDRFAVVEDGNVLDEFPSNVTKDLTIQAIFVQKVRNYEVKVVPNNIEYGTVNGSGFNAPYGSVIVVNNNTLTIEGLTPVVATPNAETSEFKYSFVGFTGIPEDFTVRGELTITANFKREYKKFDIIYKDMKGNDFSGTHEEGYPTIHTFGSATILDNPTRANYVFGGWYLNSNLSGEAITELSAEGYTSNITLYAKWMVNLTAEVVGAEASNNWQIVANWTYGGNTVSTTLNSTTTSGLIVAGSVITVTSTFAGNADENNYQMLIISKNGSIEQVCYNQSDLAASQPLSGTFEADAIIGLTYKKAYKFNNVATVEGVSATVTVDGTKILGDGFVVYSADSKLSVFVNTSAISSNGKDFVGFSYSTLNGTIVNTTSVFAEGDNVVRKISDNNYEIDGTSAVVGIELIIQNRATLTGVQVGESQLLDNLTLKSEQGFVKVLASNTTYELYAGEWEISYTANSTVEDIKAELQKVFTNNTVESKVVDGKTVYYITLTQA